MHITSSTTSDGVIERRFILNDIPGVLWAPESAGGVRPLVLLAHGGGQSTTAPGLVARARQYVTDGRFAVAAIDAPGHGDRPKTEQDVRFANDIRERIAAGEPVTEYVTKYNTEIAARAVPEWRTLLDAVPALEESPEARAVGFWGVSMGTAIGVALAAVEPRISAALLGLAGHHALVEAAARVAIPIRFLLQWDDELVPRAAGLALFDAFASREKTLHANPGRHREVPAFEMEDAARFFARHLDAPGGPATA